jgi:predicted tellurium resistance membrane protein TerC
MDSEALTTLARKRARMTGIVLGASVTVCVLLLIYTFIQKQEANKQRLRAEYLQIQVDMLRKDDEECRKAIEGAMSRAERMLLEAVQSSQNEKEEAEKNRK